MSTLGELTPFWALSLTYWLHMLATVVWIGGLVSLVIIVLPVAKHTLEPELFAQFLAGVQRRLDPLGWLSLSVLLVTGLFQMSASPNYLGFLSISNRWATSILIKHILFLGMIVLSAYMTWGLFPAIRRNALLIAKGSDAKEGGDLESREIFLLRLNLLFSVLILGLTALARAS